MKNFIILLLIFITGCSPGFQVAPYSPSDMEKMVAQIDAIKSAYLIKEMDFSSNEGLQNGATVVNKKLSLENPNNENQYVDTNTSLKNINQSTISIWFKTEDIHKIQHIFWQGVSDQNGWGGGTDSNTKSEFNITLNHYSDTSGFVISSFLGYNESSSPPDLLAVMFPVTKNHTSGVFSTTGQTFPLDTNWHHLVVSIDQKASEIELKTYIDGRLLEGGFGYQIDTSIWNTNLFIGKPGVNGQRNFWGQLKQFMIFNKILSSEEIQSLYNVQLSQE